MLKQVLSITALGLRSIPERIGPTLVIVVGLAGVVAVFTALLAMAAGFSSTLESAGRSDVALVLRGGSQAELNSGISREQGTIIKQAPGVAKGPDGQPLASAEVVVIAELLKPGEKTGSNITVRGVEPTAFPLRPQLRIVEGRSIRTGPARADRRPGRRSPVRGRATRPGDPHARLRLDGGRRVRVR